MRVFCASVATETNTFSPLRTDFTDFAQSFYAAPDEHPETPTLCSAVFPALRNLTPSGKIRGGKPNSSPIDPSVFIRNS